jgi:hypothetical protein
MKYSGKEDIVVRNTMILGGSRIGIKTAKDMENHSNVKLIEIDYNKCKQISETIDKTLVIKGDGRDINLLRECGIGKYGRLYSGYGQLGDKYPFLPYCKKTRCKKGYMRGGKF